MSCSRQASVTWKLVTRIELWWGEKLRKENGLPGPRMRCTTVTVALGSPVLNFEVRRGNKDSLISVFSIAVDVEW